MALFAAGLLVRAGSAGAAVCAAGFQDMGGSVCTADLVVTGAPETLILPPTISVIRAVVSGAAGGTSLEEQVGASSLGGLGGRETAVIPVAAGATLTVIVGQAGADGVLVPLGYGGYGGGGHPPSRNAGTGGGGSFVFDANGPLIVAGGGGGGGHDPNPTYRGFGDQQAPGGAGSGAEPADNGQSVAFCCDPTFNPPPHYPPGGGGGATPTSPGLGGHPDSRTYLSFGPIDGETGWGPATDPLNLGKGGDSYIGNAYPWVGNGAGGGGGYYGGGGGGNTEGDLEGGGGGGGAGYVTPAAISSTSQKGVQVLDGEVFVSYYFGSCATSCVTCSGPTSNECASCAPGQALVGGACVADVDACVHNPCGANATCTDLPPPAGDTPAGRTCACNTGYSGDGIVCTDIDECTLGTAGCDVNATCTNTPGSYLCTCNSGFAGDGFVCTDIDACVNNPCGTNASCTDLPAPAPDSPAGRTCACNTGYSGDGTTCVDIDECTLGTANCSPNAACTNTPGSFLCSCKAGFSGDGVTCADIDECTLGIANCDPNATCSNTPGSFTCTCNAGYSGDGTACSPDANPGFVPPTKDSSKCEQAVAKNVGKLRACVDLCQSRAAEADLAGQTFDMVACVSGDPAKSCRAKYDLASQKLVTGGNCPPCLDGVRQGELADAAQAGSGDTVPLVYCDAAPAKNSLSCEQAVSKALSKLEQCFDKCHAKGAAAALAGNPFDEAACRTTDLQKSCRAKFDKTSSSLTAKGTCPACLGETARATLADDAQTAMRAGNGAFYCDGSVPLFP